LIAGAGRLAARNDARKLIPLSSQPERNVGKGRAIWKRHWRLLTLTVLLAVLIGSIIAVSSSLVAWVVSNPSVALADASDVAIVFTLVVLFWEIRGEEKSREFDTYERLLSDFSDITLRLVDNPALSEQVYKNENKPLNWDSYTPDQKQAYSYFDSLLGLFERVWIAKKKNSLETREVEAWRVWLRDLASIDIFQDVYGDNQAQFNSSLMREVREFISDTKKGKALSSAPTPPRA
jgi:hypothetical protein